MAALTEEQKDAYKEAFNKQKKYRSLRGYIFAQLYKDNI
jgi:heme-degrading monooxygenase HmoA